MTKSYRQVRNLVVEANPLRVDHGPRQVPLSERAEGDLAAILSVREPQIATARSGGILASHAGMGRAQTGPRRLGLAVVAAASVAAALVIASSLQHVREQGHAVQGVAATPTALRFQLAAGSTLSPANQLRQIAGRVATLPDDTGSGKYARVSTQSWSLVTSVRGGSATSAVTPVQQVQWVAADGSGQSVTTRTGQHEKETEKTSASNVTWKVGSLSTDKATLARQLQQGHPVSNGPAERLAAIHDAYDLMPLRPAVRAAVLDYLAATPGLTFNGESIDRAGRNAVAFSVDSIYSGLPTRYTLLIDARTGDLLDYEETLTQRAGALNVKIPAVISYTLITNASFTDSLS